MDPSVTGVASILLNLGFGGAMLYLVFFKIMPEARTERENARSDFLAALKELDNSLIDSVKAQDRDNAKTRLFVRAAIMVLTDKCPVAATGCPFKAHELLEEQT